MTKNDKLGVRVELDVIGTKYANGMNVEELKQLTVDVINKYRVEVGEHLTELTVDSLTYDVVTKQVMAMVCMEMPIESSGNDVVKAIDDIYSLVKTNELEIFNSAPIINTQRA